jgi:hypothetical protein
MTKIQIILSVIIGVIITGCLYYFTIETINPLYSPVSAPDQLFHQQAYTLTGGWPLKATDLVSQSKVPSGPVLGTLLVNLVVWIIVSLIVVFILNRIFVKKKNN